MPAIDETYTTVTIDGIELNADLVRLLMVQTALPYIKDRITYLECPECDSPHACQGRDAFTPMKQHKCAKCALLFS
jgi:hypothetical protein